MTEGPVEKRIQNKADAERCIISIAQYLVEYESPLAAEDLLRSVALLASALRAEATAHQQALYDVERLREELRTETATKAALQVRLGQAEQEIERLTRALLAQREGR